MAILRLLVREVLASALIRGASDGSVFRTFGEDSHAEAIVVTPTDKLMRP